MAKNKIDVTTDSLEEVVSPVISLDDMSPEVRIRHIAAKAKAEGMKTKVVTLTYNGKDNTDVNTAYLTCENQYFAISRIVPLNIPVELEVCLIDQAKSHKYILQETKGDNTIVREIPKYNVTYED